MKIYHHALLLVGGFSAGALADCPHDNVLRCLIGSSAVASPYCSSIQASATVTLRQTVVAKRDAAPTPNCLTQSANVLYPINSIASACSCLGVTQSFTTTVTSTLPSCTPRSLRKTQTGFPNNHFTYQQYYHGAGFVEAADNPGNAPGDPAPQTTTIPQSVSACSAVDQCATWAVNLSGWYFSFDLHFLPSLGIWECVAYWNPNNDASYFNVPSDSTGSYGYYAINT